MKTSNRSTFFLCLVFSALCSAAADDFLIRNGDRVVFLGDSITEQRLYTTFVEAYALTRHPDWKLSFRNVGWGGDTAWLRQRAHPNEGQLFAADETAQQEMVRGAVGRGLARDVLPLKPTLVTIKFGMNDHSYQAFREDIFRAYVRSQAELAKVLEAAGARLAFLTPQPIEEKRPDPNLDPRNQSLRRFSNGLREVAEKHRAQFIDQFDPYMAIMLRERAANAAAFIGGGDAVHPGPAGHTLMAWAILKGMGASALVARAEIGFRAQAVSAGENCRIENLKTSADSLSFDRLDQALPMPIDERANAALKLAPLLEDLNQYLLSITGLPAGKYALSIDGEVVAQADAAELEKGLNLATRAGPITRQSQELLGRVYRKNDLFFTRWRTVELFDFPAWAQGPELEGRRQAELARLDRAIADEEAQIEELRKPKRHHFEVRKQP